MLVCFCCFLFLPLQSLIFDIYFFQPHCTVKHHDDLFTDTTSMSRTKVQLRTRRAQKIGLEMINMALSSGGQYISHSPALLSIIQEDVCRSMILACFDTASDHLLRCALEVFQHLIIHCRMHLKRYCSHQARPHSFRPHSFAQLSCGNLVFFCLFFGLLLIFVHVLLICFLVKLVCFF